MDEVEWDPNKDRANQSRHGVSFDEAATVFNDPLEITVPDPTHSLTENRFYSIGRSESEKLLVVVYTERNGKIRMISARRPTRTERRIYEDAERS
jgi:uncharacterized DUF497 family protein